MRKTWKLLLIALVTVITLIAIYSTSISKPHQTVRKRLDELKYYSNYTHALIAFQKMNGLVRDGKLRPEVIEALRNPVSPKANQMHRGIHTEADLVRQVMTVYRDGEIVRILPISSGSGKRFKEPEGGGQSSRDPCRHL